jgi:hypothetical protein
MMNSVWRFICAPFRWIAAFVGWIHSAFCSLLTEEGRRAWAVVVAFGCGVVETVYSAFALYYARTHPMLVFWLGLTSQFIVLVVITAFTGLLIKREIGGSISKEGGGIIGSFNIKDQ